MSTVTRSADVDERWEPLEGVLHCHWQGGGCDEADIPHPSEFWNCLREFIFYLPCFFKLFFSSSFKKKILTQFHVVDILCKTVISLQLCMFKSSQWQTFESSHGDPAVQVFNSNASGCLFADAERHHSLSKHLPRTVGPFFETLWPRWMIKTDHDNNSYVDQFQDEKTLSSLGRKLFLVYA